MNTHAPLRIAVVGLAGIGRTHVRILGSHDDFELAGVCDVSPAALADCETNSPRYADFDRLLAEARPDGVVLATPPASHLSLTRRAAEAGVHVLAEKPMAESVASAAAMIAAGDAARVTLMIGQKKRFVPALARLKALLDGELGPARVVIYRYVHPGRSRKHWFWSEEDGGGPLRENAVHAADLLRWLCGEVARLEGEADHFTLEERRPQLNCATLALRFESGAIGSLTAGMVGTPALAFEDLYIATDAGVAEVSGSFDNPGTLRWARRGEREPHVEKFDDDPFRLELEHFAACARTGAAPLTNGREGLRSLALCERWKRELRRPE